MAVTKVLNIGDCGTGYHGKHLKAAIDYIKASEKTDNGRLVGGINCQPDFAYDRMKSTKVKFGKTDKRQAYHFIISFEEGEVDDDTAFEITQRFAKEYIGNEYEVVFSVHNNTDHKHGHIIFNSVNMVNGKKYRYEKGDWAKYIQPLTNRLCEEYGLSTIDISADGKGINERYKDWNPYRDGKFIWKDMVMRDVDSCIVQASTYDSFLELMEEKGYTIKQGKHMAVMMPGMKRYMRIDTWGSEYTKERITERIREESIADYKPQKERSQPKIVYYKFTRYKRAKLIIKLINSVADVVNNDASIEGKIKVVFIENYRVSNAEIIFAAADVSEQISTASREASGTGNMKFMLNGAPTLGTMDGANVEIVEEVGIENAFIFGLSAEEVMKYEREGGYNPMDIYNNNQAVRRVLTQLIDGTYAPDDPDRFRDLYDSLTKEDVYFILKDFDSYAEAQQKVDKAYQDEKGWAKMAMLNTACAGKFSSDRTIEEYAKEIWKLKKVKVSLDK